MGLKKRIDGLLKVEMTKKTFIVAAIVAVVVASVLTSVVTAVLHAAMGV